MQSFRVFPATGASLALIAGMFSIDIMVLVPAAAYAQDFPNKPIRIVTTGIGGAADFLVRLIAPGLAGNLGQQVIVDNRAAGIIPGDTVAKAAPDGYTVLAYGQPLWLGSLMQNTPYDPVRDFSPITLATRAPNILVVHPSLPVKSVKELIALARAKPGELNYASPAIGGSAHLAAELFNVMAGVNIVRINYKSAGAGMTDLIAGQVQLTFGTAGSVATHIKSGRLRALAVTSAEPSALMPGLPAVAASGLPGYEVVAVVGIFAPAKTPGAIIRRLNQGIVQILNQSDVKEKLFNAGVETVASSPDQLAATVKSEMTRLGKVIKDAGIRAE